MFCVYETFGVLKRKWLEKSDAFNYDRACHAIHSYLTTDKITLCKTDVLSSPDFFEAYKLRQEYAMDFSDILLLLDMKQGFTGSAAGESQATLLTADQKLANVAKAMELKVTCLLDYDPSVGG